MDKKKKTTKQLTKKFENFYKYEIDAMNESTDKMICKNKNLLKQCNFELKIKNKEHKIKIAASEYQIIIWNYNYIVN